GPSSVLRKTEAKKSANLTVRAFYVTTVAGLFAHDFAETHPLRAVEARQLHRLDRREVGGAGVDLDAGQQAIGREVLQAGRLLHHIRPRQVVAGLFENLHQALRDAPAVVVLRGSEIAFR